MDGDEFLMRRIAALIIIAMGLVLATHIASHHRPCTEADIRITSAWVDDRPVIALQGCSAKNIVSDVEVMPYGGEANVDNLESV